MKAMYLASSLFLLLLLAGPSASSDKYASTPQPSDLVGIWDICYEPHLEGVSEVDRVSLVFLPDGRYAKFVGAHIVDDQIATTLGRFRIENGVVILSPATRMLPDGSASRGEYFPASKLKYSSSAEVSFAIARDDVVTLPVLSVGESLNYAFAKVF